MSENIPRRGNINAVGSISKQKGADKIEDVRDHTAAD